MTIFIDSHMHLDLTWRFLPERIPWMREKDYLPVSWAFGSGIHTTADLYGYLKFQQETLHKISDSGLACYYLAGIHPRNIPADLDVDRIPRLLAPFIKDPLCLGLGEIGLETGSLEECAVLTAQMAYAGSVMAKGKVVGLHTPRQNKTRITRQLLKVLEPFAHMKAAMVIDHCTPDTIGDVLKKGYWAGVTVSPVKSNAEDVAGILANFTDHLSRIMLNTDSGGKFFEDLFLLDSDPTIGKPEKQRLLKANAAAFFGITV